VTSGINPAAWNPAPTIARTLVSRCNQRKLGEREVRNALQSSGAMAFRIDAMDAILRFEDGLDGDRPNRSAH
jgi:hypothetical protein